MDNSNNNGLEYDDNSDMSDKKPHRKGFRNGFGVGIATGIVATIVHKLQLDTISKDNPKAVEILLPYTASADGSDDEFAKEAFRRRLVRAAAVFQEGARHTVRPDC